MFSQSAIEELGFYVYLLQDPRDGQTFYVGKGSGNRVFAHTNEAVELDWSNDKLDQIREIHDAGMDVEQIILRHGLTEDTAEAIEAAMIDFLGKDNLSNKQGGLYSKEYGLKTVDEIRAMYEAQPLDTDEPVVLINLNRLYPRCKTEIDLYETTRKAWRVGNRRDKATYAIATYHGLTRAAYLISEWYRIPMEDGKIRWGFHGDKVTDHVGETLLYKSVSHFQKKGAANPIKYLNCDPHPAKQNRDADKMNRTQKTATPAANSLSTDEPIMLIIINRLYRPGMSAEELYEATRKRWAVGPRRNGAKYAVATYHGETKEVYQIGEWYEDTQESDKTRRYAFNGKVAPEPIRSLLKDKSISHLQKRGAVSPIKYLNC